MKRVEIKIEDRYFKKMQEKAESSCYDRPRVDYRQSAENKKAEIKQKKSGRKRKERKEI